MGGVEQAQDHFRLPVATEARESDHLAPVHGKVGPGDLPLGADHDLAEIPVLPVHLPVAALLDHVAHGLDQAGAVEAVDRPVGDDPAVAHDDDPVRGGKDFPQQVGYQDDRAAAGDERADIVQQLLGLALVEGGGRLVQDDDARRRAVGGEGAGDFHHLPPGDGQVADHRVGRNAVAREDRVQLAADDPRGLGLPEQAVDRFQRTPAGFPRPSGWGTATVPGTRNAGPRHAPCRWNRSVAPATRMEPASGCMTPARMFIRVDLPAPLWPTRPRHWPASIDRLDV